MGAEKFSIWRNNFLTGLGYKDLDNFVLEKISNKSPKIKLKKNYATTFIQLNLDQKKFTWFVKDPTSHKPKVLWDSICDHFATKSLENVVNQMDRLENIQFSEGNLWVSINKLRETFKLLLEVSDGSLESATIETLWSTIILKRLPPLFSVICSLQFAQYKGKKAKIPLDYFLSDLELEIQRLEDS